VSLSRWGWNSYFEAMWNEADRADVAPARVVAQQRNCWRVAGTFDECLAEATGKLRLDAEEGADWPAAGDWLAVELRGSSDMAAMRAVLPRQTRFTRKAPGKRIEEQVIAANVDTALLVSALDGDFSPRRVERYIAQCWESGVRPILLLNKADACENAIERAAEIERVALGAAVYVVSAKTGEGMAEVELLLKPGQTFVMLGSSGVGKSTLTNRLLGRSLQKKMMCGRTTLAADTQLRPASFLLCPAERCSWIRQDCANCIYGMRTKVWRRLSPKLNCLRAVAASKTAVMRRSRLRRASCGAGGNSGLGAVRKSKEAPARAGISAA
jgi:hypothetical protein